jgi:hypothetical protein
VECNSTEKGPCGVLDVIIEQGVVVSFGETPDLVILVAVFIAVNEIKRSIIKLQTDMDGIIFMNFLTKIRSGD